MMKDQFLLLLTALGCSVAAWVFWHYFGSDAVVVVMMIALISSVADNLRLRRRLRETQRRD